MSSPSQDEFTPASPPPPLPPESHDPEDATQLVKDALFGDEQALRLLVNRLTPVIQSRVARALLRRRAQAFGREVRQELEDFTQEVFVSLLADQGKVLRSWSPDRGLSFDNFIGLVADRQVATILRTGKRNPWKEDPTLDVGLEKIVENDQDRDSGGLLRGSSAEYKIEGRVAVKEMLDRLWGRLCEELSPLGRQMFILLYLQELSVEEVCDKLDMSPDAVYAWRSRLVRVSRRLFREIMSENGSETRRS